jgi:glyceraldehyde-3-phosphate dehydrogenase/erythrose-4-phosphate dehydrogenase
MGTRIGINGFGRIGRNVPRAATEMGSGYDNEWDFSCRMVDLPTCLAGRS